MLYLSFLNDFNFRCTFSNKHTTLQFYIKWGIVVEKLHAVYQFNQENFLKDYINKNINTGFSTNAISACSIKSSSLYISRHFFLCYSKQQITKAKLWREGLSTFFCIIYPPSMHDAKNVAKIIISSSSQYIVIISF